MSHIMSVNGPIEAGLLGFTHSHEHVLWDYWDLFPSYDHVHDDEAVAISELEDFRLAGGRSMVECSTVGIRTDPGALQRISQISGVNLILGAGWYRERVYPRVVFETTANALADVLIDEITMGIGDSGVRPGLIGEIGTERKFISPAEERVFRAAARASLETGLSILTHTTHFGDLALDQIDLLTQAGVDANKIIISHLGDRTDMAPLLKIAERGVYLSIDNVGYLGEGYPSDEVRAANVVQLVDAGYGNQVVLGTDIATKSALKTFGGRGYSWLQTSFLPRLRSHGLNDDHLHALTTTNIARALSP